AVLGHEDAATSERIHVPEAFARTSIDHVRIVWVHHERSHRKIGHEVVHGYPALAAVIGTPDAAPHARNPHDSVVSRVHQERTRTATNVARSKGHPLARCQASHGRRYDREMRG